MLLQKYDSWTVLDKTTWDNKPQRLTTNNTTSLSQHGCKQEGDDNEIELEPRLAKVLEIMTSKLMTAIKDKLEPWHSSHTPTSWRGRGTDWMRWRPECYTWKLLMSRRLLKFLPCQSTNDPSLLWETYKAEIRGLIITYSVSKKKKTEQQLKLEFELMDIRRALWSSSDPLLLQRKCATQAALDAILTHRAKCTICTIDNFNSCDNSIRLTKYLSHLTKVKTGPQVIPLHFRCERCMSFWQQKYY